MSTINTVTRTENQMTTTYDVSKFLHGDNEFIDADVTASGANVVLTEGLVMGRIAATQLLVPADKDATDGSQYPVGCCVIDQTVVDGTTKSVRLVNKGIIAESKVDFLDTETLATTIGPANNLKSYRDLMNDLGLIFRLASENTEFDN